MNFFILIMLFICLIGLLDKILNNRLGLVESFDKGINSMGSIAMSMIGFYCIAITLIQNNVDVITNISKNSLLDPSIIIGSILAPDMGGFSIVSGLHNEAFLIFSGVILTSTLGQTISFQLPIFLASLKKEDLHPFISGLVYGILSLPLVLIVVALYLKVPHLLINLLPILVLCLILVIGLYFSYEKTIIVLTLFGQMDRKGKMMNAAFSVAGAYVFGGQLGFISSVVDNQGVLIFILSKLIAGVIAVVFVMLFYKEKECLECD